MTFKALLPALLLAVATVPAVGLLAVTARDDAAEVAIVFPPWTDAAVRAGAVAAAGGRLVRTGAVSFVWVVRSDVPGLPGRLRAAGAGVLLDPRSVAGCIAPEGPARTSESQGALR